MLSKIDTVEIFTAKKNKYFHYDKEKREEKNSKKMRLVIIYDIFIKSKKNPIIY